MRVRVGQVYKWNPVLLDACDARLQSVERGLFLKVINMPGCPRANTMGHCYVETLQEEFLGLVCCNSLEPLDKKTGATVRRQWGV